MSYAVVTHPPHLDNCSVSVESITLTVTKSAKRFQQSAVVLTRIKKVQPKMKGVQQMKAPISSSRGLLCFIDLVFISIFMSRRECVLD